MISITDDVGRQVRLVHAARRVVSLVPSLTETLFVLGRGSVIVGATRYCTEPRAGVHGLARVGGTKNPAVRGICTLRPDLVVCSAEETRQEDFEALVRAGLTVFVAFPRRARAVAGLVRRLGTLVGARSTAETLAQEQESVLRQVGQRRGRRRPRVFCPIWKGPWMSFNRDTYADDLLRCAGARNVSGAHDQRYCTISLEEIAAADPEVILLPSEPYRFTRRILPALAPLCATPAWRANRIHFIDGKTLFWYGARTAMALRALHALITSAGNSGEGR